MYMKCGIEEGVTMSLSFVVVPADEALPLESHSLNVSEGVNLRVLLEQQASFRLGDSIKLAPLLLPASDDSSAGLYAYSSTDALPKNVRATRLAMACGNLSSRFHGDILLFRANGGRGWQDLAVKEIYGAACISSDLRPQIQAALRNKEELVNVPEWLANAAQQNYHDTAAISRLFSVMCKSGNCNKSGESNNDDSASSDNEKQEEHNMVDKIDNEPISDCAVTPSTDNTAKQFIAHTSLCLHCRGPSTSLCPDCEGAYFCERPRHCRQSGWSHECLCSAWKLYTGRRTELSTFPFDEWHFQLLGRDCQFSEEPYQQFLTESLGLALDHSSWWRTEIDGWSGGDSRSAQTVDASQRRTYAEGFAPVKHFPPDRRVSLKDLARMDDESTNACGLTTFSTWEDYYELRNIPLSSPVALLLTFPLTIYFAIAKFGEVPVTVARILKRPLRLHVVGIEKEMNFLDIFREIGYLLPEDLLVELTFVIRRDMLPPKSRKYGSTNTSFLKIELTTNVTLQVVSGTYGDDLDPNFDCGGGPPDMVIGLNAGLFAYESWRSVITYLFHRGGVVAVFTDYNEHSGMNCASIGGAKARESLCVNPFRQPRAMPVMSMNLPQFSNGFMYVYNAHELDA